MPDTYRLRMSQTGPGQGQVTLILERTAGTDCVEVSLEFSSPYNWHPQRNNWVFRETGNAGGPCVLCMTPAEASP